MEKDPEHGWLACSYVIHGDTCQGPPTCWASVEDELNFYSGECQALECMHDIHRNDTNCTEDMMASIEVKAKVMPEMPTDMPHDWEMPEAPVAEECVWDKKAEWMHREAEIPFPVQFAMSQDQFSSCGEMRCRAIVKFNNDNTHEGPCEEIIALIEKKAGNKERKREERQQEKAEATAEAM